MPPPHLLTLGVDLLQNGFDDGIEYLGGLFAGHQDSRADHAFHRRGFGFLDQEEPFGTIGEAGVARRPAHELLVRVVPDLSLIHNSRSRRLVQGN